MGSLSQTHPFLGISIEPPPSPPTHTERRGYDHIPVSRGYVRAQYPLLMPPPPPHDWCAMSTPVRTAEHCCICIPARACVERFLNCVRPPPPPHTHMLKTQLPKKAPTLVQKATPPWG